MEHNNQVDKSRTLRLWPGIVILLLIILIRYLIPQFFPVNMLVSFAGGVIGGILVLLWWLFFSRVSWTDRLIGAGLAVASLLVASRFLDESVARANMGIMFWLFSIPVTGIAFVLWAALTKSFSLRTRRITMIMAVLLASGFWVCLRTNGMNGNGGQYFDWRWSGTYEDRVLSLSKPEAPPVSSSDTSAVLPNWPGFRGKERDGIARGTRIKTDWTRTPAEIWRRPVGPGCGSFAVAGNYFYTQEQRGENESVSCYELRTGKLAWIHNDKARFYEPHAGAGPRSTPAISGHLLCTLGATGILNLLDARDGKVIWTRNTRTDTGEKTPGWGFCGSPLVYKNLVIVAVSGRLAAYDISDGRPVWSGPGGGESYCSPQIFTVNGVLQVLLPSPAGILSVDPDNGKKLWNYEWKIEGRILQPLMVKDGVFLLTGENQSIRLLSVSADGGNWNIKQLWESPSVKAYFNDFVAWKGFAYGYDGPTMTCTDLSNGKKMWKGSRYRGFQVLVPDQDLIVVLTEKGEIAMVSADPARFTEQIKFQALKGRTWNHPAFAGNILLVRNDREMAAYNLAEN
ncbi:MAG TPA: PQQ-binding-like beta-propeller repeat protein [Bacteroidales bacterium]|nr:PQQ-binding-like beta-propeller repeat protein [Bacteroidales bacterium]